MLILVTELSSDSFLKTSKTCLTAGKGVSASEAMPLSGVPGSEGVSTLIKLESLGLSPLSEPL